MFEKERVIKRMLIVLGTALLGIFMVRFILYTTDLLELGLRTNTDSLKVWGIIGGQLFLLLGSFLLVTVGIPGVIYFIIKYFILLIAIYIIHCSKYLIKLVIFIARLPFRILKIDTVSDKDLRNTNLLREGLDDYNIVGKIYGEKEYGNKLEKEYYIFKRFNIPNGGCVYIPYSVNKNKYINGYVIGTNINLDIIPYRPYGRIIKTKKKISRCIDEKIIKEERKPISLDEACIKKMCENLAKEEINLLKEKSKREVDIRGLFYISPIPMLILAVILGMWVILEYMWNLIPYIGERNLLTAIWFITCSIVVILMVVIMIWLIKRFKRAVGSLVGSKEDEEWNGDYIEIEGINKCLIGVRNAKEMREEGELWLEGGEIVLVEKEYYESGEFFNSELYKLEEYTLDDIYEIKLIREKEKDISELPIRKESKLRKWIRLKGRGNIELGEKIKINLNEAEKKCGRVLEELKSMFKKVVEKKFKTWVITIIINSIMVVLVAMLMTAGYAKDWAEKNINWQDVEEKGFGKTLAFELSLTDSDVGYPSESIVEFPFVPPAGTFLEPVRDILAEQEVLKIHTISNILLNKLNFILGGNPKEEFIKWTKFIETFPNAKLYNSRYKGEILKGFWSFHFFDINIVIVMLGLIGFLFGVGSVLMEIILLFLRAFRIPDIFFRLAVKKYQKKIRDKINGEAYDFVYRVLESEIIEMGEK
ncbi:hypothetical protein B0S90_0280 [Caldicellulosiruptor bescii]|uniref:Uncharacterized protein n=3 Tax=Caldicellulosiruptor bescii TaxID=31899 RepID=B9ML53_CALBD|nr:hypothetical protein Athe_0019 [Caldicellulosiruptor bescii DSM 6725]PBC88363.1 hypothetical protein B0S87_1345 [Caldicellulosiruptor bescii]PBC92156.1 hypothetical protein B0S89_2648 [Caldicellulosiruptor bescii]PBD05034.1 hypothetical protein B0S85_2758 [Caldicellulosiruptor bescii]PBD05335.1 hypothetical protein B0S90_0280 [Caldicellulosiruptor bescii]